MSTHRETACVPIAVLAGGRSPEHRVSVESAGQVLRGLDLDRWRPYVARLDDTDGGAWHVRRQPWTAADGDHESPLGIPMLSIDGQLAPRWTGCGWSVAPRSSFRCSMVQAGEDGSIQGLLWLLGMPFVGSGIAASAIAIDKLRTRMRWPRRTSHWPRLTSAPRGCGTRTHSREHEAVRTTVGYPCYAKVDTSGSSLGVARLDGRDELARFFAANREMGRRWIAEARSRGEEISVPVLGNSGGERLEALPPIGIYPVADRHFSFKAKYTSGGSEEVVPPRDSTRVRSRPFSAWRSGVTKFCNATGCPAPT